MFRINMSKAQATQIANTIFADIKEYIQNHQEEYAQFLKENGGNDK